MWFADLNCLKLKKKKYLWAVARKLNLPRDKKRQVISDLENAITTSLEAGETLDDILGELGKPKQAAAVLNEQMKAYTYRKSPWRFLFAGLAVCGGAQLLSGLWFKVFYQILVAYCEIRTVWNPGETYSIGVIGGADGPTAVFVAKPEWTYSVLPVIVLITGILGYLRLSRCKQK